MQRDGIVAVAGILQIDKNKKNKLFTIVVIVK